MEVTKGSSTSEFKLTLLAQVLGSALIGLGLINPAEADTVIQHLLIIIGGIYAVITSALYIYNRMAVKTTALEVDKSRTIG